MPAKKRGRRVKKKKTTASYAQVMHGSVNKKGKLRKTAGGLKKSDSKVIKQSDGSKRYVSKKRSSAAKKNPWIKAVTKARKNLGTEGFVILNRGKEGKELYKEAKRIYKQ